MAFLVGSVSAVLQRRPCMAYLVGKAKRVTGQVGFVQQKPKFAVSEGHDVWVVLVVCASFISMVLLCGA